MYYANDKKFGFWIKRDTWENTIAKVISIEGVIEGEKISGRPPYYNNPKVVAEFYKKYNKQDCNSENLDNISEVSCPSNYSYSLR